MEHKCQAQLAKGYPTRNSDAARMDFPPVDFILNKDKIIPPVNNGVEIFGGNGNKW